ncbi:MAG: cytochrome c oxidase assembly protein [Sphingomonas sp.]|nr:cytochrome c oxidase assembly protein [Sphingomonas sp.]MBW0007240.1 cytochrome c oxidase assembly protein [Sphingomonas sp.]
MRLLPLILLFIAAPALAHGGHGQEPGWTLDPLLTVPLALSLLIYLVGWSRLAKRATTPVRPGLFLSGWAVLTLSLTSPLHEAGERSFTMHMIEHELIMLVATLLLAASSAGGVLAWGLPRPLRQGLGGSWKSPLQSLWRRLTEPVTATIVQGVVMWVWHAPPLFDRALDSFAWHVTQHACFFLSSLLFWWSMIHPRRGSGYGVSAACLFVTSLIGGALGALMSLSSSPWYADYAAMGMTGIGLDPVDDQRLAGLIMWIPGGAFHGIATIILVYKWLRSSEAGHAALPVH